MTSSPRWIARRANATSLEIDSLPGSCGTRSVRGAMQRSRAASTSSSPRPQSRTSSPERPPSWTPSERIGRTRAGDTAGRSLLASLRTAPGLGARRSPTCSRGAARSLQCKRDLHHGRRCNHVEPPAWRHAGKRAPTVWGGRASTSERREHLSDSDDRPDAPRGPCRRRGSGEAAGSTQGPRASARHGRHRKPSVLNPSWPAWTAPRAAAPGKGGVKLPVIRHRSFVVSRPTRHISSVEALAERYVARDVRIVQAGSSHPDRSSLGCGLPATL